MSKLGRAMLVAASALATGAEAAMAAMQGPALVPKKGPPAPNMGRIFGTIIDPKDGTQHKLVLPRRTRRLTGRLQSQNRSAVANGFTASRVPELGFNAGFRALSTPDILKLLTERAWLPELKRRVRIIRRAEVRAERAAQRAAKNVRGAR